MMTLAQMKKKRNGAHQLRTLLPGLIKASLIKAITISQATTETTTTTLRLTLMGSEQSQAGGTAVLNLLRYVGHQH